MIEQEQQSCISSVRRRTPEIMDDAALPGDDLRRALRAIARLNAASRTASSLWRRIVRLRRDRKLASLHLLDVACGNGNVVVALARRARRASWKFEFAGCDRSAVAVEAARDLAYRAGVSDCVSFFQADAIVDDLGGPYDAAVSSLFLHHLDESEAVAVLRRAAAVSRHLVLMDDLCRSRRGYMLAHWSCRLLTRSPVVRFDGPASVTSSFTPAEALTLARRAGLAEAVVTRRWPQRYELAWRRTATAALSAE